MQGPSVPLRSPSPHGHRFPLSGDLFPLRASLFGHLSVKGLGPLIVRVPGCPKNRGPQLAQSIHHHHGTPPLGLLPDSEVTDEKKLRCIPFPWENMGKGYYAKGPKRRVFTIEALDPDEEKWRVSAVVVYTFS